MNATFKVGSVIACDDARKEVTGKDILIGVYPDGINATQIPGTIPIAFWIEIIPSQLGKLDIEARVELPDGTSPANIRMSAMVARLGGFSLVVPAFPYGFQKPGALKLFIRHPSDQEWQKIKQIQIEYAPNMVHPNLRPDMRPENKK